MNKIRISKKIALFLFSSLVIFISIELLVGGFSSMFVGNNAVDQCELGLNRFEQDFFSINPNDFNQDFSIIQSKYPNFVADKTLDFKHDVLLDDTLNFILDSVNLSFGQEFPRYSEIQQAFCQYKKYFPLDSFAIYTYIDNNFNYRYPVVFADGKLLVRLDFFLGKDHTFYASLPEYIRFGHDTTYLPATCFVTLAGRHIPQPRLNNFLSSILYHAKAYFFAQRMLPDISEDILFKSPLEKMEWCQKNERVIWEYMIQKDYVFSTDPDLIDRFVSLAPFSKFGLDIDRNSPGGVGVWLGLQILNSYYENNDLTLIDVLNEEDYRKILNKSGYKP